MSVAWQLKGNGVLYFEAESNLCLRPVQPPQVPKDCKAGTPLMVGQNACMKVNASAGWHPPSGSIYSPDCAGLCAVVDAQGTPVLGDCASSAAEGWSVSAPGVGAVPM